MNKTAKKTLLLLLSMVSMQACNSTPKPGANSSVANAGNQNCPVSGKPVNGVDTHIHDGTEYNLCGAGCKQSFAESPEKYVK